MAQYSGIAMTNERAGSVAQVQHSEPTVTLLGRVAAGIIGNVGRLGEGGKQDLHFTLIIDDAYSGIFGFDGQPTISDSSQFSIDSPRESLNRMTQIRTMFYRNTLPADVIIEISIDPPQGMSRQLFAQKFNTSSAQFRKLHATLFCPQENRWRSNAGGNYNSSSYIAGLLNSVMGYVPKLSIPNHQAPGWEMPIPNSYFKGESLK